MHTKFERLLSKSLTALEVMSYYLVVRTGPGWLVGCFTPQQHATETDLPRQVYTLPHFEVADPTFYLTQSHHLVGLVVRRPPRERKILGSNPACAGIFSGSSHTSDLNIGTPVATLPGAWRYRISAGTGRPGVSIQ